MFDQSNIVPSASNSVTDIDGNVYKTVTIGTQVWMAENLKVTHYRNGDAIPNVTDANAWERLVDVSQKRKISIHPAEIEGTGAYCNFDNEINNAAIYGRLYNWHAVNEGKRTYGVRDIAPAGWHVATYDEWQTLIKHLGGVTVAGGKMKEMGTAHWCEPNRGASNSSGFFAIPGGYRDEYGNFRKIGVYARFWSETKSYSYLACYLHLSSEFSLDECDMREGFSVRCIKH
jgi:uncharacterized protein (TIGR02145 family)